MTTMIAEVYEALKEANASDAAAWHAAEALSVYEARFAHLEAMVGRIDERLVLVQWLLVLLLAGVASLIIKAFI